MVWREKKSHKKRTVDIPFFFYGGKTVSETVCDTDLDTGHGGIGRFVFTIVHDSHVVTVIVGQPFIVIVGIGDIGVKRCPFRQGISISKGIFIDLVAVAFRFDPSIVIGSADGMRTGFVLQSDKFFCLVP